LSTKIVVPGCGTLTMQRQHASSSQRTGTTHRDQTTRALAAWSPETGPLLSRDQHAAVPMLSLLKYADRKAALAEKVP
jgi:hypothetical protein